MKKTIIGLSLVLGLALVATVALARGPGFGPGFGRGVGEPGFPPIPGLTAEQSVQIQALRDGFLKEVEPLRKELYTIRTELRNLWAGSNPDQAAITAKQREISDLRSQLQEKATRFRLEIGKVLTPEQLAQLPGFGPGPGFGQGKGFGPRMGMRGPFGRQ